MKKLLSYMIVAWLTTVAVSIAAPSQADMLAKEKAAWQAFKDKDAASFQKLVDPEVVGVYAGGINGMQDELAGMKKWSMQSFEISAFKGRADGADTFVTSYSIKLVGTVDKRNASGTYYAGSVWKMKNGQWRAIFHADAQKKEIH